MMRLIAGVVVALLLVAAVLSWSRSRLAMDPARRPVCRGRAGSRLSLDAAWRRPLSGRSRDSGALRLRIHAAQRGSRNRFHAAQGRSRSRPQRRGPAAHQPAGDRGSAAGRTEIRLGKGRTRNLAARDRGSNAHGGCLPHRGHQHRSPGRARRRRLLGATLRLGAARCLPEEARRALLLKRGDELPAREEE